MYYENLEINFDELNESQKYELAKAYYKLVLEESYLLLRGVRSCSWQHLPIEVLPYIDTKLYQFWNNNNIHFTITDANEYIIGIFLYLYTFQRRLINIYLQDINVNTPDDKRFVADYIIGTLLGYSQDNINDFMNHNYSNLLNR